MAPSAAGPYHRAMTMGEDLLLLAIKPGNGRIRVVERLGVALRATELVELTMAGRVTVAGNRITVADPAPIGTKRLDQALASLQIGRGEPELDTWLRDSLPGPGMIRRYLSTLADQRVLRIRRSGTGLAASTRIVLLDAERRDRALARVDRAARRGSDAD